MMRTATSPAIPIPVSFATCYAAWRRTRRGKRPSMNRLAFEGHWLDRLLALKTDLREGRWQPARTVSFVVDHPKTREIHAPDFADRIVHHLLVERLEKLYEPVFIHDSFANRKGKGSHAAVDRLQSFMRSRNGQGWFLQLDIHNFFNTIHRPTLYQLLCRRIERVARHAGRRACPRPDRGPESGSVWRRMTPDSAGRSPVYPEPVEGLHPGYSEPHELGPGCGSGFSRESRAHSRLKPLLQDATACLPARTGLPLAHAQALRSLCHKLLAGKTQERVRDPAKAARLPPHKRLANAAPGCGLPVGNLTSQFFANVYLNELDQFVKHTLKCRHYLRYVDDFILLADAPEQLQAWQAQIADFLQERLHLRCKDEALLAPLREGVDFLGYRSFTHHRLVRPRVVTHCCEKLEAWGRKHVQRCLRTDHVARMQAKPESGNPGWQGTPDSVALHPGYGGPREPGQFIWLKAPVADLHAMLASYWGHFTHADSVRLRQSLFARFPWLDCLYHLQADGSLNPRWELDAASFAGQCDALRAAWPQALCLIEKGNRFLSLSPWERVGVREKDAAARFEGAHIRRVRTAHADQAFAHAVACDDGRNGAQCAPYGLGHEFDAVGVQAFKARLRAAGVAYVCAAQTGWLRHGARRREIVEWFVPV